MCSSAWRRSPPATWCPRFGPRVITGGLLISLVGVVWLIFDVVYLGDGVTALDLAIPMTLTVGIGSGLALPTTIGMALEAVRGPHGAPRPACSAPLSSSRVPSGSR